MIPQILHQTWKSKDVPEQWQAAYSSCQKELSDYTRYLWTDAEMDSFVKTQFPTVYNTYKSYRYHIQRCDAFRYMALYFYGGVYLDLDIACKAPLNSLLQYDVVMSRSSNWGGSVTNSFFMARPGHPFFKYLIDNLEKYQDSWSWFGKHLHVMNSTGPLYVGKMYKQYVARNGPIPNIYFMSKKEYAGDCNVCNVSTCTGGEYFDHVGGNSWHGWDSTLYNAMMCHWDKVLLFLVVSLAVIFYYQKAQRR